MRRRLRRGLVDTLGRRGGGLVIATVTAPVGVSGAVFLLPVQLSVLGVPSPAVTPTNLLFNVVAGPGALLRHRSQGSLNTPLTRRLIAGSLAGVMLGAVIRVFAVPGPQVFRLLVAVVLLPPGIWLCIRTLGAGTAPGPASHHRVMSSAWHSSSGSSAGSRVRRDREANVLRFTHDLRVPASSRSVAVVPREIDRSWIANAANRDCADGSCPGLGAHGCCSVPNRRD
jgi:hypothetical protein